MEIRQDDPAADHVSALLAHHLAELRSVMSSHAFALDSTGLSAPNVTFWTAWKGDELAGFVALKALGDRAGELKSMRAAQALRGTGVGRALLAHVIAEARVRRMARLYLETGTTALHAPAVALYRSAGFESRGAFADYAVSPHNQFLVLRL
ncbi:MAG: GNAT family N-acetyltransferase [Sandarakinorhabdus sp.]|nr:GNAT family N-acetyltransferase [Sandarakinorhabdus sp.]